MALSTGGVAIVTGAGKVSLILTPTHVSLYFAPYSRQKLTLGIGSGIGKACVLAYAAEGAKGVVIADVNYQTALQTAKESERLASNKDYKALAVAVDVTNASSVDDMVTAAVESFGRIDYLVNSAGIGVKDHLTIDQVDPAEMNRFWQINIIGTVNCIKSVTKVMKKQSIASFTSRGSTREVGRGVILNLGSANSYMATPEVSPYVTTKHAVIGLTKSSGESITRKRRKNCRLNPLLNTVYSFGPREVPNSSQCDMPRLD